MLKSRLKEEGAEELLTTCKQLKLIAADGKSRPTDVADFQTLFRIIQSVPSAKAEPIKQWMAKVASERIDEIQDHMTRTDSALNTLAEVAATELSQKVDPKGFTEQKSVAQRGGKVAATARRELEKQLGQSVVTRQNVKSLHAPEDPKEIEEQMAASSLPF